MKKIKLFTTGVAALTIIACASAGLVSHVKAASATEKTPTLNGIQNKMLNAVDNYGDIKGTYHIVQKPINVDDNIDFEIQETGTPGSYVKATDKLSNKFIEQRSDGNSVILSDPGKKEFRKDKILKLDTPKNKPRFSKHEDGTDEYIYRQDPAWSTLSSDVTFPQTYGFWLNDASTSIVGQEKYLNRDAVLITGKLEPIIAEKHQASNFKMWVDSATGVLLKLEETNNKNEITNQIEVLDLKVNQGVDKSKFNTVKPAGLTDKSKFQQD